MAISARLLEHLHLAPDLVVVEVSVLDAIHNRLGIDWAFNISGISRW